MLEGHSLMIDHIDSHEILLSWASLAFLTLVQEGRANVEKNVKGTFGNYMHQGVLAFFRACVNFPHLVEHGS